MVECKYTLQPSWQLRGPKLKAKMHADVSLLENGPAPPWPALSCRYIVTQSRQAVDVADAVKLVNHLELLTGDVVVHV